MKIIDVKDKRFELFLSQSIIEEAIDNIAASMTKDLKDKNPLFICVLNGSFMFASELMKRIPVPSELSFVKMSSYNGTSSSGNVRQVYGLEEDITDRTVVIIEDIVDTGNTLVNMLEKLLELNPKEIKVATLLLKPDALENELALDYIALEVPNDFIIGYGLDYDGYGRNFPDIYKIIN